MGSAFQGRHASIPTEVFRPIERDIAGASQRRQAEPDGRDLQTGGAQRPERRNRGRRSGYGCLRIRAFSSWNSASESTPDCFSSPICRSCW
jgi:hypothetical protein